MKQLKKTLTVFVLSCVLLLGCASSASAWRFGGPINGKSESFIDALGTPTVKKTTTKKWDAYAKNPLDTLNPNRGNIVIKLYLRHKTTTSDLVGQFDIYEGTRNNGANTGKVGYGYKIHGKRQYSYDGKAIVDGEYNIN